MTSIVSIRIRVVSEVPHGNTKRNLLHPIQNILFSCQKVDDRFFYPNLTLWLTRDVKFDGISIVHFKL